MVIRKGTVIRYNLYRKGADPLANTLSRATLGRLPQYLRCVRNADVEKISAAQISRELGLGEVQVRKDLASVCTAGLPKVGYPVARLKRDMERALGVDTPMDAVIIGAGKLGAALMEYDGFLEYGMRIVAGFDRTPKEMPGLRHCAPVYSMQELEKFCRAHQVKTGILTVPAASAQSAADEMVAAGLTAILNFAPVSIKAPSYVTVHQENIALSLAYLHVMADGSLRENEEEQYGREKG